MGLSLWEKYHTATIIRQPFEWKYFKRFDSKEKYSMYMWVYMKTSNYSRSSNKCALKCRELKRVWEEP